MYLLFIHVDIINHKIVRCFDIIQNMTLMCYTWGLKKLASNSVFGDKSLYKVCFNCNRNTSTTHLLTLVCPARHPHQKHTKSVRYSPYLSNKNEKSIFHVEKNIVFCTCKKKSQHVLNQLSLQKCMRLLSLAATAVLKNSPFRGTCIQTTEWNSRRSDLKYGNSSFTFQAFEHS